MLKLKRVIIFTSKMDQLSKFYGEQLGLPSKIDPAFNKSEWIEFNSGSARIALHKAAGSKGAGGALKIVFYSSDVPKDREVLLKKKVKMGAVNTFGKLQLCDGCDPDGNRIQISNRK